MYGELRRDSYGFALLLRDILIEHLDGVAVDMSCAPPHSRRRRGIMTLMSRGLIKGKGLTHTVITDKGRKELSFLLADHADALMRVGYGDPVDDKTMVVTDFEGVRGMGVESVRALSLGWIASKAERS